MNSLSKHTDTKSHFNVITMQKIHMRIYAAIEICYFANGIGALRGLLNDYSEI